MSKLVNKFFVFFITLFFILSAQAEICTISKNDINSLVNRMENNELLFTSKGFFVDLKNESYHTSSGSEFEDYVKKHGIKNVMFETNRQYQFFISYLEAIKHEPCMFIQSKDNKVNNHFSISFYTEGSAYTFRSDIKNNTHINIHLNIEEHDIKDISYFDERSYIYSFVKKQDIIYFEKINAAG